MSAISIPSEILSTLSNRMGIESLNPMQEKAYEAPVTKDLILLAPTGTGKTIAFALAMLRNISGKEAGVAPQALVICPSRELALQIYSVVQPLAKWLKTTVLYGGHNVADETASLTPVPDIVIATPGRLLDHLQRGNLIVHSPHCLVLDEYDKTLQLGFEDEIKRIMARIGTPGRVILTSATALEPMPDYIGLRKGTTVIDLTSSAKPKVEYVEVKSFVADKLNTLVDLLATFEPESRAIVFANHRESAERIASYLRRLKYPVALYHGGLDQRERATAIDTLQSGVTPILVATDLASRGLDIDSLTDVIHYHLPVDAETWTHRNGRTARQGAEGRVWLLTGPDETTPEYAPEMRLFVPQGRDEHFTPHSPAVAMICFGAGKKEKISKGDVAGMIAASGIVERTEIGLIKVYDHYALATVPAKHLRTLTEALRQMRLKGKKVRVTEVCTLR